MNGLVPRYSALARLLAEAEKLPKPLDRLTLPQTVTLDRWAWEALNRGETVTLSLYRP